MTSSRRSAKPRPSYYWTAAIFCVFTVMAAWGSHGRLWGHLRITPDQARAHIGERVEFRDLTVWRRVDCSKGICYLNLGGQYPKHIAAIAVDSDTWPVAYAAALALDPAEDTTAGTHQLHAARGTLARSRSGAPILWVRRAGDLEVAEPAGYEDDRTEPGGSMR